MIATSLLTGGAAHADTTQDETAARAWLTAHGVSLDQQDNIMEKLKRNELPESSIPEAVPVTTSTSLDGDFQTVTERFVDGSVLVYGIEMPILVRQSELSQPNAISECAYYTGGGYSVATGCRIFQTSVIGTLEFRADYQRYVGGSQINAAYQASFNSYYGVGTSPTVSIVKGTGNSSNPAVATAHSWYKSHNGQSSEDIYLSLRVTPESAYTTTY